MLTVRAMDVTVFLEPKLDLPALQHILDGLGHAGRVHTIRTWGKRQQAALFEAAKGVMPLGIDFLVPSGLEPLVPVAHHGKNTLPAFSHFQKRFTRLPEGSAHPIGGYNHQSMSAFTGPGYFVAGPGIEDHEGELVIDYRSVPTDKPLGWPAIQDNGGRGALVYGGMVDYLRGLSTHVSIGRAAKGGKMMDQWFALVREDPA